MSGGLHPDSSSKPASFRLAICNEVFQGMEFDKACRLAKAAGFAGIEIAPFTLSDNPAFLPAATRKNVRAILEGEGLEFVGLHLLLPPLSDLHITTPDDFVRNRSWEYIRRLTDLCADLGNGGVMVFGSARQRSTLRNYPVSKAVGRLQEGLAALAPAAQARKIMLLIEPLSPDFTDVIPCLAEAVDLVNAINHPAVGTMLDFRHAGAEQTPAAKLIRDHFPCLFHLHLNELDGRHPGTGKFDFKPAFRVLKELSWSKWLSVEVFDFATGGERIAFESARFLRQEEANLADAKLAGQYS